MWLTFCPRIPAVESIFNVASTYSSRLSVFPTLRNNCRPQCWAQQCWMLLLAFARIFNSKPLLARGRLTFLGRYKTLCNHAIYSFFQSSTELVVEKFHKPLGNHRFCHHSGPRFIFVLSSLTLRISTQALALRQSESANPL